MSNHPPTDSLKILRVIASMNPANGGPCQGIRNSVPELQKLGIFNEVVCLDSPTADYLGRDNFIINAIGPARGPWAFNRKLIPWLLNNLSRFDAVIIHGLWLYHGYAVFQAFRRASTNSQETESGNRASMPIPALYVIPHGMLDPYFQRDSSRRFKACRNWLYWKLIEGKIINTADAVLFTCAEELRLARESFSPYFPKMEVDVGYGVPEPPPKKPEIEAAFRAKAGCSVGRSYLLFLSRIHVKKGVDLLIRAYSDLIANGSDTHGRDFPDLVIAGPLDSEYGRAMQVLAADLLPKISGGPQILFSGMLSGDEKWGAFHFCDAFILPSHQENFGIAVAEALACAKPVLISNKVNIWPEVEKSGGGLINADSIGGTEKMLSEFFRMSDDERRSMATQARRCYEENFGMRSVALRWARFFRNKS